MRHEQLTRPIERLYTVDEAAKELHEAISPRAIYAAIADGRLAAQRIGRRYFIAHGELGRFARCPDRRSPRDFGSATTAHGSSSTAAVSTGQAIAERAADALLRRR
jgi:excisionase family DNA binding protein